MLPTVSRLETALHDLGFVTPDIAVAPTFTYTVLLPIDKTESHISPKPSY